MTNRTPEAAPTAKPVSAAVDHPVVVATNGQNGSDALRAAASLAAHHGSKVVVVSVIDPEPTLTYEPELGFLSPEYEAMRRKTRLADVRKQLGRMPGGAVDWPTEIRFGTAAESITDEARRLSAWLIVMESGRHDPIARLLAGETTLRTIRRAGSPVLAVNGELAAPPRVAVAAMDFSPSSISAARSALDLLADGATLFLLHIWSRSASDHPSERARDDAYERKLGGLFSRVEEILHARPGITIRHVSLLGAPVPAILEFATSHGADLISAGRRGHGLFERLLVGSVTTALVRGATCSVLVTPEPVSTEADELARSVTGVFESRAPQEWADLLDRFSRRNAGRRTLLEVDDARIGTQMQATGYALLGAAYDRNDQRIQLMLGDPANVAAHLTHTIHDVTAVEVRSQPGKEDEALQVTHRAGRALLLFLAPGAAA